MKKNKIKYFGVIFITFLFIILLTLNLFQNKKYTITLTKEGFTPSYLNIKKGDIVIFKNNTDKPFWPASDLHPTHGVYPDFDPKQPIDPNQSWNFKFDKEGTFLFHDHLSSSYKGTIVSGKSTKIDNDCSGVNQNTSPCWSKMINKTLEDEGLSRAFDLVENLYKNEPVFANDCHQYLHNLGEAMYKDFVNNEDIILGESSAYCGYGFYHGFMEKLLIESGDLSGASSFCKKVAADSTPTLVDACYHGAGHGAVSIGVTNTKNWGNNSAIISDSLSICKKITGNSLSNSRCASGVFMEISDYMASGQYGLSVNKSNPFRDCENLNDEGVKMACYTQLYSVLRSASGGNLSKAIKYIESIPEDSYALESIETLIGSESGIISKGPVEILKICHSIQDRLRLRCINGIALVYLLNGRPKEEYKQAIDFCSSNSLNFEEKNSCYKLVVRHTRNTYSDEEFKNICSEVNKKFIIDCSI